MSEDHQINRRLTRIEDQIDAILSQLPGEKKEKSGIVKQAQEIAILIAAALTAVAGSAFIFYAFGYVIVNSYLASYGVRVSELTNPAYIPAGLSFVLIGLLIPAAVVVVMWRAVRFGKHQSGCISWVVSFGIALVIGVIVWWLTNTVLSVLSGNSNTPPEFVSTYAVFAALACAIYVLSVDQILSVKETGKLKELISVVFAAICMLAALLYWSKTVYPYLGYAVGGGQTVEVQFSVLDSKNEQLFKAIGIGVDNRFHLTEPVHFLVDMSDGFLVLLKDGSAVRIDKKLVTNFRYTSPMTTSTSVTSTLPISTTPTIIAPSSITPTP